MTIQHIILWLQIIEIVTKEIVKLRIVLHKNDKQHLNGTKHF